MNASRIFKSRLFWVIAVPVLLVGLYALLGFKVAPGIVRDQAQKFVREHYGRELQLGEVRIHPFKLQLEVKDLALPDADGQTMIGFQRLFVDFELASLWERALVFKDIDVDAPLLRAVVRPDGALNLADLALPPDPEEEDSPPPSLWIRSLVVDQGTLDFVDQARRTPYQRTFSDVGFALEDFRTTPEGGDFRFTANSRAEESFEWKGRFALAPVIASEGEFKVARLQAPGIGEFLGDALPFELASGTVDLAGSYKTTLGDPLTLEVILPQVGLAGLALRARGESEDWIRLPAITVADTALSLVGQSVTIGRIGLDDVLVQAWLEPDGSVNLTRLFAPESTTGAADELPAAEPAAEASPGAEAAPPESDAPSNGPATGQPWSVTVAAIELNRAGVDFEDRTATPARQFSIRPIDARLTDASLDLAKPIPVTLTATINEHAGFESSGTITPEPLAAELDVKLSKARMEILQPYVLPLADLTITGGELNVSGKARLAPPGGEGPEAGFTGEVSIDGFKSIDNALKEDLVNFQRLELQKIRFALAPDSLDIDRVRVTGPYARVIISPEQVLNIAAVLDPEGTAAAAAERRAEAAAEAARSPAEKRRLEKEREAAEKAAAKATKEQRNVATQPESAAPTEEAMPIRIREIRVDRGRMNFSDFYVQPNFAAEVENLSGSVTGLSSAPDARAKLDLEGRVDEFSPVSIKGELQPFAFDRYSDVEMKFENISLPIFNPYSGPLAGFNIAKGKLTTDLHYVIVDRQLDAQHKIRIDQLEWGAASDTKGEATLPIKFATSLLKDRDGVIRLDVPVGGTLDDPTFKIGPIVWQIIKNIITKAVTAPFALLGSLFEGAEDAQFVDFAPGDAALDGATAERLASLAKSLVEKPELSLDVPIGAIEEIDRPMLAERAYEAALAAAVAEHAGGKRGSDQPPPAFGELKPRQQIDVLTAMIQAGTGAAPQVPEPPPPPEGASRAEAKAARQAAAVEYLEAEARAGVTVPEAALKQLAEQRAEAIQRALLGGAPLEPTRVFTVLDGKVSSHEGKVRFELGLK